MLKLQLTPKGNDSNYGFLSLVLQLKFLCPLVLKAAV